MKNSRRKHFLVGALVFLYALASTTTQAQDKPTFDGSFTLADNHPVPPDGSAAGDDQVNQQAELAKKLQNPVASLISVPIQNNWDCGIGPANAMKYTANIQPVVPLSISEDWNLIIRTIMPVIYLEPTAKNLLAPASARESHSGLGDITQSFFFSPKAPVGGWIIGAGPVGYYPTATDSALGASQWGAGPTIVVLQQKNGFSYGALANHIWSFIGWGNQEINSTFMQPFLSYTTKTYTTFTVNSETSYNWATHESTAPMNFMVQQLLKIHGQPIALQAGYRYYVEKPDGGPDWGLRFAITFLFPKG